MPCSDLMLTRRDDLTCCQICGVVIEKDLAIWLDEDYPLCEKCWDSIRDDEEVEDE